MCFYKKNRLSHTLNILSRCIERTFVWRLLIKWYKKTWLLWKIKKNQNAISFILLTTWYPYAFSLLYWVSSSSVRLNGPYTSSDFSTLKRITDKTTIIHTNTCNVKERSIFQGFGFECVESIRAAIPRKLRRRYRSALIAPLLLPPP